MRGMYIILKIIIIKVSFKSNIMWCVQENREEKEKGRETSLHPGPTP